MERLTSLAALSLENTDPEMSVSLGWPVHDRELGAIVLKQHKTAWKVGRPRVIPVGKRLAELIEQAIGDRTEGPIFLRRSGKPWTTNTISQQFRQQRNRAGLPKDLCLYLTRREHGTKLCAATGIKAAA